MIDLTILDTEFHLFAKIKYGLSTLMIDRVVNRGSHIATEKDFLDIKKLMKIKISRILTF